MNVLPLPYDMGNAGDLIKHGLVAEYVQWWLDNHDGDFLFVDPFGGRPYIAPPNEIVIRRLDQLPDCALKQAQPHYHSRYYGSGNVVRNIAEQNNRTAEVLISDRDPAALDNLLGAGFRQLQWKGFDPQDSFSIVHSMPDKNNGEVSLLLLDPFDDFLSDYAVTLVPELTAFITEYAIPVMLFVLCRKWNNDIGLMWQQLRERYFSPYFPQVSLTCEKIPGSTVKGEANFASQVVLLLPSDWYNNRLTDLVSRLHMFSDGLGQVLGQPINTEITNR